MVHITSALLDPWLSCCLGRRDDYAVQQDDGRYLRAGQPLTYEIVSHHLQGLLTLGTYVIDEDGLCHFIVFDSDDVITGLTDLYALQVSLAGVGVRSYLELSRRGAHLWIFLVDPVSPALARQWLLPYCPPGVEFYPKQDLLTPERPYGSLMRLPLGVHRLSGQRYPFVEIVNGSAVPVAVSVVEILHAFSSFERVRAPQFAPTALAMNATASIPGDIPFKVFSSQPLPIVAVQSIHEWCLSYDPLTVISRYVALDGKGMGCCPFGWHHDDGIDTHPSLWVYRPSAPDMYCWYCHTWQQGGSLFDFLRYYYGLDARDLWSRILSGAHF